MRAVIPFKKNNAKSRLSSLLSDREREELAITMLKDVAGALLSSGCFDKIDILSTSIIEFDGVDIVLTESGLNESLNDYLNKMSAHSIDEPVLIIMADIPLVTSKNIKDILASTADITIAPGRMGGTNVLLIRDPSNFQVDYYGGSFLKHCEIAARNGKSVMVFDSFNLSSDIDEVQDLAEVLIHGTGYAAQYLRKIKIMLEQNGGRGRVKRDMLHHV